ncbi:MAG TPA: hypothetical protein VLX92_28295, partial [Kofleriaceae bacterium]|nr:hypothetical protein [Kofleriaceae bacterium]
AGIAAGAAFGYGKPRWRLALGALAIVPLLALAPTAPVLALAAALLALGLAAGGPRGVAGALGVMLAAALALVAMWSAQRVAHAEAVVRWPASATAAASAGALAITFVLALVPRHLRIERDPVGAAMRALPPMIERDVRELCVRSIAIWNGARRELPAGDPGRQLVRDGVVKTLEVAARTIALAPKGAGERELAERMTELDHRIAEARDPEERAQYEAARATLDDQRALGDELLQRRARVVARLHHHVAALEKLRLAATAETPALRQLEELSHEVAASGEALAAA